YSTYLGGAGTDGGMGIAVDGSGNAYVIGQIGSTDFPTEDPYQTDQPGDDAFVTKLSASYSRPNRSARPADVARKPRSKAKETDHERHEMYALRVYGARYAGRRRRPR